MKKLKLNLDEIKVESFETETKELDPKGTIFAQNATPASSPVLTCQTWGGSCGSGMCQCITEGGVTKCWAC